MGEAQTPTQSYLYTTGTHHRGSDPEEDTDQTTGRRPASGSVRSARADHLREEWSGPNATQPLVLGDPTAHKGAAVSGTTSKTESTVKAQSQPTSTQYATATTQETAPRTTETNNTQIAAQVSVERQLERIARLFPDLAARYKTAGDTSSALATLEGRLTYYKQLCTEERILQERVYALERKKVLFGLIRVPVDIEIVLDEERQLLREVQQVLRHFKQDLDNTLTTYEALKDTERTSEIRAACQARVENLMIKIRYHEAIEALLSRNLRSLEERKARYGIDSPTALVNELAYTKKLLDEHRRERGRLRWQLQKEFSITPRSLHKLEENDSQAILALIAHILPPDIRGMTVMKRTTHADNVAQAVTGDTNEAKPLDQVLTRYKKLCAEEQRLQQVVSKLSRQQAMGALETPIEIEIKLEQEQAQLREVQATLRQLEQKVGQTQEAWNAMESRDKTEEIRASYQARVDNMIEGIAQHRENERILIDNIQYLKERQAKYGLEPPTALINELWFTQLLLERTKQERVAIEQQLHEQYHIDSQQLEGITFYKDTELPRLAERLLAQRQALNGSY